jgi:hypothetical protein
MSTKILRPPLTPRFENTEPSVFDDAIQGAVKTGQRGVNWLADLLLGATPEEEAQNAILSSMNPLGIGTVLAKRMTPSLYRAAVKNTPAADIDANDILRVLMERRQLPEQAGQTAGRGGVFFAPKGHPGLSSFTHRRYMPFGGPDVAQASGEFKNPFIVRGGFGNMPTQRAYEHFTGKEWRDLVGELNEVASRARNPEGGLDAGEIWDFLERHGGNPELAGEIVSGSPYRRTVRTFRPSGEMDMDWGSYGSGMQRRIGVLENIAAQQAKNRDVDAIVGVSRRKGAPAISEIFDLTRSDNPTNIVKENPLTMWHRGSNIQRRR